MNDNSKTATDRKGATREISLTEDEQAIMRAALAVYARETRHWAVQDSSDHWLKNGKVADRLHEHLQDAADVTMTIDLTERRQRRRWERERAQLRDAITVQLREAVIPGQREQRGLSTNELSARMGGGPSTGTLKYELEQMQRDWLAEQVPGTLSPTGRVTASTRWRLPYTALLRHETALLREAVTTALSEQPGLMTRDLAAQISTRDLSDIRHELGSMQREDLIYPDPGTLSPAGQVALATRWTLRNLPVSS